MKTFVTEDFLNSLVEYMLNGATHGSHPFNDMYTICSKDVKIYIFKYETCLWNIYKVSFEAEGKEFEIQVSPPIIFFNKRLRPLYAACKHIIQKIEENLKNMQPNLEEFEKKLKAAVESQKAKNLQD